MGITQRIEWATSLKARNMTLLDPLAAMNIGTQQENLLISADSTAEIITKRAHMKDLDSRIPKIFSFTRIAQFIPEVYSNKYLELSFISATF